MSFGKTIQKKALQFFKAHRFGISVTVLVLFMASMIFRGLMQIPQIEKNRETITSLNEQIEYEKRRTEEIEELKGKVNSDEYIEKVAREKLGYIKQNEKIFIDISAQDSID